MPYVFDPNMLDDEKRKQQQENDVIQPQTGGGGDGELVGGGTQKQSSSTGGTQSGQFTNLKSYLDANQSQNFGGKVADRVGQDVTGAEQEQTRAGDEFNQQVGQNRVEFNEGLSNEVKQNAYGVANDAQKRSQFERMRDASYRGPQDLSDLTDTYGRATAANDRAKQAAEATKSEQAQRSLLNNYYGRPTYSRGETNLDQFLVQNDASAQPKFQQVQQQGGQLGQKFEALKTLLGQNAQQAKQQTAATKERVQNEFLGPQGELANRQAAIQQAQQRAQQQVDAARGDIAQGFAPTQDLEGLDTAGLDVASFLNPQQVGVSEALDQPTAQNYAALNQLLAQQDTLGVDPSKAGSFNLGSSLGLNRDALAQAVAQKRSGIDSDTQNIIGTQTPELFQLASQAAQRYGADTTQVQNAAQNARFAQNALSRGGLSPQQQANYTAQVQNFQNLMKQISGYNKKLGKRS